MKIHRQFQDLHLDSPAVDWVLKQQIERDICLLYHQLADYSYIMGDLYYGDVFALPYWDYLDFQGLDPNDSSFIRDGCLVMILAMAAECIDDTGFYLRQHLPLCRVRVGALAATDADSRRLIETARQALELVETGVAESAEFTASMQWVHERYVHRYFIGRADDFRTNPYFTRAGT